MSDKWDFYFSNVNDALASIFVDLGIRGCIPDSQKPWLLWTWIRFLQPRDNGLSSEQEANTLFEIEDFLQATVANQTEGAFVGRITTSGRREFYFYAPSSHGFDVAMNAVPAKFPAYSIDYGDQDDSEWSQYLNVLYPGPEELQLIRNRHVVESLERNGDTLTVARPVFHWVDFRSQDQRMEFIAEVKRLGFRVPTEHEGERGDEFPSRVTIERIDHVDWKSINDVTLMLYRLALQFSGNYDGWETSVEKHK